MVAPNYATVAQRWRQKKKKKKKKSNVSCRMKSVSDLLMSGQKEKKKKKIQ